MIYTILQLYWSFFKIGVTSFGGLSMIPLISSEMISHGWMTNSEISDIVAIAEMTPGPLGLNCATFAGMKAAGIFGAAAANIGVLTPTLTIAAIAAVFFEKWKKGKAMERILIGIRPACIGMVVGILLSLSLTNYFTTTASGGRMISPTSVVIGLLDVFLLLKVKLSIPKVICISAAIGAICFGFLGL